VVTAGACMLVLKPVMKMTALTGGAIAAAKANGLARTQAVADNR